MPAIVTSQSDGSELARQGDQHVFPFAYRGGGRPNARGQRSHVQSHLLHQSPLRYLEMANDKTKKKAAKKVEKAVRKAVKKGVSEEVVEKAVELGMSKAVPKKPVRTAAAKADERKARTA